MARSRNYIEEILEKQQRHLKRVDRFEQFTRRVVPLIKGFRHLLAMDPKTDFRREWLKYGAIGYIACVEGYFRILYADLVNFGEPYLGRVSEFKDIRLNLDDVVAIHSRKVSLGEYVSHFLPLNGVQDINRCLSTLIGEDFLKLYKSSPTSGRVSKPIGEVFPREIANVETLFQLRHLYAHELAPKVKIQTRRVQQCISSTAGFVQHTEGLIQKHYLK